MSMSLYCSNGQSAPCPHGHAPGWLTVSALQQSAASGATDPATASAADGAVPATEFRPVKSGNDEIQSGEWLLVEAYVAMWLLALGLVLITIFKQRKLDAHIEQLSIELAQFRKQQDQTDGSAGRGDS
ncbi:MAG TPA: hypothetical protein ENK23_01550 [Sorangium sp.]|nr:hypothetical protein [Sorangium sp.]